MCHSAHGRFDVRTDPVSTVQNLVQPMDPHLQNAWGVTNSPGGPPPWVADCNYRLSTLDDCNGVKQGFDRDNPVCLPTEQRTARRPRPGWYGIPIAGFSILAGSATVPAIRNDCGLEPGRRSDRCRSSTGDSCRRQFFERCALQRPRLRHQSTSMAISWIELLMS